MTMASNNKDQKDIEESSEGNTAPVDIPNQDGPASSDNGSRRPKPTSDTTRQQLRLSSSDMHTGFIQGQIPQGSSSSWSTSSDKQLFASPKATDRVFPIRSVVGIDPSQTPSAFRGRTSGEINDYFPAGASLTSSTGQETPGSSRQYTVGSSMSEAGNAPLRSRRAPSEAQTSLEAERNRRRQSASQHDPNSKSRGGTGMLLFNNKAPSEVSSEQASAIGSIKSPSIGSHTPADRHSMEDNESVYGLVTARFKHIVTAEGHAVITGRDGETLQRCEDEPIHIPGAVQGFGLLIALVEDDQGRLVVRVVSENSGRIIGYTPKELFELKGFADILSEEQQDNLLDHVDFIRDEEADPATNGPEVFIITIRPPTSPRRSRKLWCAMHINPNQPDIIICEFELDDDQANPLIPRNEVTAKPPEDTLNSNPTPEEFHNSTEVVSKPLRILRSARKRHGEAAAMEVFNIMSQVQEQLASASNLDQFLKVLVGVVKELTGFHRVMIYQFDNSFNGRVVTELVDPRATKDLYKGLDFPASDIPKQARELYKINKVRMLYDRDMETARLVCRSIEDLEQPLDLTFSYLRAMSPIHIKYLANMAVRSSMSISINAFRELWGLIACHSYGPQGMRVSFPIRKMCRLVGDVASRNIERLSYASRLQARKLINTVSTQANPSGYIIASSDDLLQLFDADFGMLSIRGETKILGKMGQSQEGLAMLEYLRLRKITSVLTSQDVKEDFPDLRYAPGFELISGLLLVPLSVGGSDFIVFFRKGQTKEVKWAGNPYEKFIKAGTEGYLEPRKSFKTWSETVVGKCREWTEEQIETAAVLCLVYGKFIEVWRQKEAALQNSQLTRLLLANSAHEVRTPLNAIINYLEIALEGALDQETRENLAKSHSASKSLIYVINDLLDLTKTEEGQELVKDEIFNLPATIREATDQFKGDAKRKGLQYEFMERPGVPQYVQGDQRRVRQAIANLTANAFQHTSTGSIGVELWLVEIQDRTVTVEIVVQDTGIGMSNKKLDALFRELEQVSTDIDGVVVSNNEQQAAEEEKGALGLGLAMVARIIRNMDGQLRLKSAEGEGSRFVIQLPFSLPDEDATLPEPDGKSLINSASPSVRTPPPTEGEVTLVRKGSALRHEGVVRQRSLDEIASVHSNRSTASTMSRDSGKSGMDRLIDAISGPLAEGESDNEDRRSTGKLSNHSLKSASSVSNVATHAAYSDAAIKVGRITSAPAPSLRRPSEPSIGSENVQDSQTPIKAVKMPEEFQAAEPHVASRVFFRLPEKREPKKLDANHLQILVAEDDPVNSRIIRKRLEKMGHVIHHTLNGEECASAYCEWPDRYDVVLMDMQMPIVDGLTSTKMIRSFEKSHAGSKLSARATGNGRVPIFAVSASLVERETQTYIDAGFDGWILKPIDFKRVNKLIDGIVNDKTRESCLYESGEWERGGWFCRRQPSALSATTTPSNETPAPKMQELSADSSGDTSVTSSNEGSMTPTTTESHKPLVIDDRIAENKKVRERQSLELGHCSGSLRSGEPTSRQQHPDLKNIKD